MVLRKKRSRGVARKKRRKRKKKAERESLELLASGCPEHQDVPSVRIPGVSCLASGRSRQDILLQSRQGLSIQHRMQTYF